MFLPNFVDLKLTGKLIKIYKGGGERERVYQLM